VFGVAAGVVVLAMLGFVIGWALHSSGSTTAQPATSATPPSPSASPAASETPSPVQSITLVTLGPLVLPDLTGQDFISSRWQLRDLQLGVQLVFDPGASAATGVPDGAVERTQPAAGEPVAPGITVKLYVSGTAPLLAPPDVVGRACNEAGKAVADSGLYPQYPGGRQGTVTSQDPAANDTGVHWNDQVQLFCQA
jgi:beta-lactam-binding protein with PASTA domain